MLRTGLNAVERTSKISSSIHPAATSEMYDFLCVYMPETLVFLAVKVSSSALLIQHFNGLTWLIMLRDW